MTRPSGRSPELVAKAPVATTAIRVLGPLEVVRDGQGIRLGSAQRRLLAVLLAHANEIVSTDRLLEALWGEGSRARATGGRSTSVARLQSSDELTSRWTYRARGPSSSASRSPSRSNTSEITTCAPSLAKSLASASP